MYNSSFSELSEVQAYFLGSGEKTINLGAFTGHVTIDSSLKVLTTDNLVIGCGFKYEIFRVEKYEREEDGSIALAPDYIKESISIAMNEDDASLLLSVNLEPGEGIEGGVYVVVVKGYMEDFPSYKSFTRIKVEFSDCLFAELVSPAINFEQ